MSDVVHAEWTKVRTLPGTGWLLLAAAALTAAVGAVAANSVSCPAGGCQLDPAKVSLTGIYRVYLRLTGRRFVEAGQPINQPLLPRVASEPPAAGRAL